MRNMYSGDADYGDTFIEVVHRGCSSLYKRCGAWERAPKFKRWSVPFHAAAKNNSTRKTYARDPSSKGKPWARCVSSIQHKTFFFSLSSWNMFKVQHHEANYLW